MSEQTKLNLQPESESIENSQIPAAADDEKSVFLMFEQIQFDLFERWIRLGLIFLDPIDSSEDGLYKGLPFSLVPVDSDVLVEVHLTQEEFEKSELCGKDKNVGWLNPGLLPVTRIRKVLFKTHDLLVQAHNQMSIGSKVPEILKSYQAGGCWAVQDEPVMTKEEAFQALRQSSRDDEPSNIQSSLEDWDYIYGRMSFLRSVATAFPSRIQGTILNHISHLVAGTWPGLDEVVQDFQSLSPFADRNTIIKLSGISAEIQRYYKGENGPELSQDLGQSRETFTKELGKLIGQSDCWFGERIASDKPLDLSFKYMQEVSDSEKLSDLLFTEALCILSLNARRLNIRSGGEPATSSSRTRNFEFNGKQIPMTCKREDAMNAFLSECCFSRVVGEKFNSDYWLTYLNLEEEGIFASKGDNLTIFGIEVPKKDNMPVRDVRQLIDDLWQNKRQLEQELNETKKQLIEKEEELTVQKSLVAEIQKTVDEVGKKISGLINSGKT